MFKSRLQVRRVKKTVAVKVKTLASGKYTEANVTGLSAVSATYEQRNALEEGTDVGGTVNVLDIFFFERLVASGVLPAIREQHVLVDTSNVRYEVVEISDEGGQGNRLKVSCRRLRSST